MTENLFETPESLTSDRPETGLAEERSPLVLMGNPVLRAVAQPVEESDSTIPALAEAMIAVMRDQGGVGLAAPQIGVSKRLFVYEIPRDRPPPEEEDVPEGAQILINPQLEPLGPEMIDGLEGCLSIPGLRGVVPRHAAVRYSGFGLDGLAVEGVATGFHARVLQHEADHLDGVLYLDRMKSMRLLAFDEEAHHLGEMIG